MGTAEVLIDLLVEGLQSWFDDTHLIFHSDSEDVQRIIEHQEKIGWDQLVMGRWSRTWSLKQTEYADKMGLPEQGASRGAPWASSIIKLIWKHCHQQWLVRNEARHGRDEESKTAARLAVARRRIEHLYTLKHYCFESEQRTWFYTTATEHFQREPRIHQQEQWLVTVTPMVMAQKKAATFRATTRQSIMDSFLEILPSLIPHDPNNLPIATLAARVAASVQNITTQITRAARQTDLRHWIANVSDNTQRQQQSPQIQSEENSNESYDGLSIFRSGCLGHPNQ